MEQNQDEPEVLETPEEEIVDAPEEETIESLKEKNAKLYTRAKQAEGFEEVDGKWVKRPKPVVETKPALKAKETDLSTTDMYALMKADVPEEDLDEVKRAAKVLGVTVAEALKDPVTKGILERRQSLRKTADATNTNPARPGTKKVTDEHLLEEASKGNLPEKGSKEAEQLFWAKRGGKK